MITKQNKLILSMEMADAYEFIDYANEMKLSHTQYKDIELRPEAVESEAGELHMPESVIVDIVIPLFTATTTVAIVKGIFELLKHYIAGKYDKEKAEIITHKPIIIKLGDKEITIPSDIDRNERDALFSTFSEMIVHDKPKENSSNQ